MDPISELHMKDTVRENLMYFQLNAMANRAAGKGYENEDNYCNIKFQFIGIENIHVMRNSLQKLIEGIVSILLSEKMNWPILTSVLDPKILLLNQLEPVYNSSPSILWEILRPLSVLIIYTEIKMFCNEAVDCTTGEFLGKADSVLGVLWIHLAFIPRLFLFCWLDDWGPFSPWFRKGGHENDIV